MGTYGYIKHSELCHHGIKGQKWHVRRYQNPDGSLTPEGRIRYGYSKSAFKDYSKLTMALKDGNGEFVDGRIKTAL